MSQFQPTTTKMLLQPVPAFVDMVNEQKLRVKYEATTWPAKLFAPTSKKVELLPGQLVRIVGIEDSITLLIEV